MKMVKKKGLKKFNISNKLAYTLIIVLSIALLGIGVYAYNLPPPTNVGHTLNELMSPCNGWLRGTSGTNSWGCTALPPSCSGTNQVLHWDGSAWSCYTVSTGGGDSCSWATWSPPCRCIGREGLECASNIYPVLVHQEYCSGGVITQERDIYCCPTDRDGLCIQT